MAGRRFRPVFRGADPEWNILRNPLAPGKPGGNAGEAMALDAESFRAGRLGQRRPEAMANSGSTGCLYWRTSLPLRQCRGAPLKRLRGCSLISSGLSGKLRPGGSLVRCASTFGNAIRVFAVWLEKDTMAEWRTFTGSVSGSLRRILQFHWGGWGVNRKRGCLPGRNGLA